MQTSEQTLHDQDEIFSEIIGQLLPEEDEIKKIIKYDIDALTNDQLKDANNNEGYKLV